MVRTNLAKQVTLLAQEAHIFLIQERTAHKRPRLWIWIEEWLQMKEPISPTLCRWEMWVEEPTYSLSKCLKSTYKTSYQWIMGNRKVPMRSTDRSNRALMSQYHVWRTRTWIEKVASKTSVTNRYRASKTKREKRERRDRQPCKTVRTHLINKAIINSSTQCLHLAIALIYWIHPISTFTRLSLTIEATCPRQRCLKMGLITILTIQSSWIIQIWCTARASNS